MILHSRCQLVHMSVIISAMQNKAGMTLWLRLRNASDERLACESLAVRTQLVLLNLVEQ